MKTVSLENGKRFVKLGVTAPPGFRWRSSPLTGQQEPFPAAGCPAGAYPAYTVDELGEMLPRETVVWWKDAGLNGEDLHAIEFKDHQRPRAQWHSIEADTMADAMALMLIWLIENGHVKAEGLG